MKVILYFIVWCFVCPLWLLTNALDRGSYIEGQLCDLEVHLKLEVQSRLNAVMNKWVDA